MTTLPATVIATLATLVTDVQASANETLSRVFFTFAGRRYELTRHGAGRTEVYEEDPSDGIFAFLGYQDELAHLPALHGRAIAEGAAALQAVHAAHWAAFLPGAETWSQPRF